MPGSWIKTASGKAFDFLNIDPESISLFDICFALSNTYRYAGQSSTLVSVAQHSIMVGDYMKQMYGPKTAKWGYFHDAAEAYVGDMPTPLKALCPEFQAVERDVQAAINLKYIGKATPDYKTAWKLKRVDRRALALEVKYAHTVECPREWEIDDVPLADEYWDAVKGLDPVQAAAMLYIHMTQGGTYGV